MFQSKIKTIEELAAISQKEKAAGRKVALCHGYFDLVHIGHIKHLAAAKKMADVLIVTLTPDRFMAKGPGRPVFNESLRLEALANLEVVDYVGLNDGPDAVSLLKRIKPNFYVKGDEYKNFKDNPDGMRIKEKEAVEAAGGQMVFTSEPTFSSTTLLNENFDFLPPDIKSFLEQVRAKYTKDEMGEFIEKLGSLKVLVVGDAIVDEYAYCWTVGTVTKSPTISAVYKNTLKMPGGALAVARHIAEFAGKVEYLGVVGDKDTEKSFIEDELGKAGIKSRLITAPNRFTTLKRRFVSGNYSTSIEFKSAPPDEKMYKIFELGFVDNSPIAKEPEEELSSAIKERAKTADLVVVADFGHGLMTQRIRELLAKEAKWWSVTAQTNSTNYGFNLATKYQKPNFICLDEVEARLALADRSKDRQDIVISLAERLDCQNILMSLGKEGLLLKADNFYHAPALTKTTVDTVGAGDAVLAMASLCGYLKYPPLVTAFFSAVMGALATQIIGNREPVRKKKLVKFIKGVW